MELTKTKFKKTELGLIPEDWKIYDVRSLIDLLTDYDANGSFASVAENVNVFDSEEYAWYVRSTDLENNSKMSDVKYVNESSYNFLKKTALFGGELLFLKRGDIGKVYLFKMKTKRATVAPNLYLLKINKYSSSKYLYYFFTSRLGQLQLKSKNASSTLGALYKDDVKDILVCLPPTLTEQKAIATALSDVDEMIAKLEKLIEKKKAIKQGVMQQLLTPPHKGGKRLEGFSGEWVEVSLDEVAELKNGYAFKSSEYDDKGAYTVVTIANVQSGYMDISNSNKIALLPTDIQKHQQLLINDILISMTGNVGRVCLVSSNHCLLNQRVGLIAGKGIDEEFLYFRLCFNDFTNSMIIAAQGGAQPNIGKKEILGFRVFIPPSNAEQKAISTIIKTISDEILSLKKRLNKLSDFKQGMMQELLTGRTRLI
jgi:type I restriction enzyme S subunit